MELSTILKDLKISSASPAGEGKQPEVPITKVLDLVQERLASSPADDLIVTGRLKQLFKLADTHWLFSDCCSNEGDDLCEAYVGLVRSLTQWAALPFCETDSASLPDSSYEGVPSKAMAVCSVLSPLLYRLSAWEKEVGSGVTHCTVAAGACSVVVAGPAASEVRTDDKPRSGPMLRLLPMLAPMCCVFAVSHFQEQAWSNPGSREAGSSLLRTLHRAGGWQNSGQLLCGKTPGDGTGILGSVLDILQPDLTKERWMRNEALKLVFSWTLLQVGRSSMAKQLDRVFPASLLISDHHLLDNQLLGVRCLHHIVLSTPAADLRQYNRAQVLYHAMFNRLYTAEPQLIQVVLLCLFDLLPVLERLPSSSLNSGAPRKPGHYDDVLRLVLTHMEMEHKVVLRRVYASCLPLFVDMMGIAVVRHLKRLERVVTGYLEVPDPLEEQARLTILDTLEKTILVAWPRMECRLGVLVRCLLRLLCDVSEEPLLATPVKQLLMDKASRCLLLLDHCTHGKLQPLFQEVDSSCASASVLKSLEKITAASQM